MLRVLQANAELSIKIDGTTYSTTATNSGTWTLLETATSTSFTDGLIFTVTATDASSNVSNTVDGQITTSPTLSEANPTTGVIAGTVTPNEQVQVFYVDGGSGGRVINDLSPSAAADAEGNWSVVSNPAVDSNEEIFIGVLDGSPEKNVDGELVRDLTYTLILQGPGETINLSTVQLPANENASDVAYGVQNLDIGAIDLSSNANNALIVDQSSILNLSDEGDTLRVDGIVGNEITISGGTTTGAINTINGESYIVYDMGNNATLYVDHDITII